MRRAEQTVPDWVIGCMDREYIIVDGGEKDPSIAIWIQTESQFFDMRIPHDRPAFAGRSSLCDFSSDELMQLARQSGDTGICSVTGDVATWKGWSDRFGFFCDDIAAFPDNGRIVQNENAIYEYDTPKCTFRYEEAWVQQPGDDGLIASLTLRDAANRGEVLAALLVTGRYAGYCERSTSANSSSLEAQLRAASRDPARMRAILDCEASYAVSEARGAEYVVRHSNLPFREGGPLDVPRMDPKQLAETEKLPSKRPNTWWQVESWFVHD